MMAQAIRGVGLEPLPLRVTAREWLRIELYGYLAARIPMVLGVDLIDYKDKANWLPIGRHAVAVLGLSFGGKPTALPGSSLLLRSSRINKIYVHDDQVGPFARMEVVEADLERDLQGQTLTHPSMTTSWPSNLAGEVRAVPLLALVPIYHKIRITLPAILERVAAVDDFCRTITQAVAQLRLGALEWDVRLSTVTDFKCEVRAVSHLTGRRRRDALTRPMPRFLWRATALRDDVPILDLLYDATDIDSGDATAACYAYDDIVDGVLVAVSNAPPAGVSLLAGARQALHALSECR
jgi:hypothetical protein